VNLPPYFMVFDVESVGLHGEGFSVGYVVVSPEGEEIAVGFAQCSPDAARGDDDGRAWVKANIPIDPAETCYESPYEVRFAFWEEWLKCKELGAVLVADCAWPVEARFLAACVDDDPVKRTWEGPYPLHDLASFRLAAGLDPLGANDRLPNELPAHDPLCDARQSARLLIEALVKIAKDVSPILSINSVTGEITLAATGSPGRPHPANRPGASGFGGDG
jgi:hypothetical protein